MLTLLRPPITAGINTVILGGQHLEQIEGAAILHQRIVAEPAAAQIAGVKLLGLVSASVRHALGMMGRSPEES